MDSYEEGEKVLFEGHEWYVDTVFSRELDGTMNLRRQRDDGKVVFRHVVTDEVEDA